jgi:hypothetical protein
MGALDYIIHLAFKRHDYAYFLALPFAFSTGYLFSLTSSKLAFAAFRVCLLSSAHCHLIFLRPIPSVSEFNDFLLKFLQVHSKISPIKTYILIHSFMYVPYFHKNQKDAS